MKIGEQAVEFNGDVVKFKPSQAKAEEMKAEVDEENNPTDDKEAKANDEEEEETIETDEDYDEIKEMVIVPLRKAYYDVKDQSNEEVLKTILVTPQEFEKDVDSNFHIDFIHALANCRARNYGLDEMDWITTKIKAGRIIPALATTTSAIAGLQTLEMVKIINENKLEEVRNAFLNLAVPSLMASEPGPPEKKKLKEGVEVDIWDIWELEMKKDAKIGDLIKKIQKKFKFEVRDIIFEGQPIYLHALDSVVDTGKKKLSLNEAFDMNKDTEEIGLTVTFANPEATDKLLDGTPPIVIKFTK